MAITHDSDWGVNSVSAGTSVALSAHTPSASTSLIVVGVTVSGGVTLSSVTDNLSNTYTIVPTNYTTAGGNHGYIAYVASPAHGSTIITVHLSASGNAVAGASAFLGTAATTPFDKAISAIGGPSGSLDSGPLGSNTSSANALLFGVGGLDSGSSTSAWTAGGVQDSGTGYAIGGQLNASPIDSVFEWQIVSSAGTWHATATNTTNTTHNWGMLLADFTDTNNGGTAYTLSGAAGVYAYLGEPATLIWGPTNYTLTAAPGNYNYAGGDSGAAYGFTASPALYSYLPGNTGLVWSGAPIVLLPSPSSLKQWIPFQMACRLRCLQQGALNVGNTQQNIANLMALALTQIAVPSNPAWAKLSGAVNMPKKILIRPAYVPGFVPPPAP